MGTLNEAETMNITSIVIIICLYIVAVVYVVNVAVSAVAVGLIFIGLTASVYALDRFAHLLAVVTTQDGVIC